MNKYTLLCLVCTLFSFSINAQFDSWNMEMLDRYDDASLTPFSGTVYNDCWGYTDDDGNEYAIMGSTNHIFFFDITDPENISLIRRFDNGDSDVPGGLFLQQSIWRDFKTYGEKAYAVADQPESTEGLIVFDLSDLPTTVTVEQQTTDFFDRAHNIYIDEARGYLYTAGTNGGTPIVVLDLKTNSIQEVANVNVSGGYVHDLHVVDDIAYCHSNTEMVIVDFSNPTNPQTLGTLGSYTNSGYNHSGWLAEDGIHYVFCDETQFRRVKIIDVSDPANISGADIKDQFFSNLLDESVSIPQNLAHNPFIKGDLVYIAYYNDGIQVFDISEPTDVEKVAYYDTHINTTYPINSQKYDGAWGVYPFFDSGTIIASDGFNGLFVLRLTEEPLPVELINFEIEVEVNKIRLDWSTSSERNSDFFEIERSSNGLDFYTIAKVAAQQNSDQITGYKRFDEQPLPGINYYRLKMVDTDGRFEYSDIRSGIFQDDQVHVVPTLVKRNENIKIFFDEMTTIGSVELIGLNGELIKSYSQEFDGGLFNIPTQELGNGLYFLRVLHDQKTSNFKVLIARN